METRKRPLDDDIVPTSAKKRALTSPTGTPQANNGLIDVEESQDQINVEAFRKEAIYRRMKHYSRECDRHAATMQSLEQRKSTCEAGLVAMTACWTQLVEAIQLLARPEGPEDGLAHDIFEMAVYVSHESMPELRTAMERKMEHTRDLLTKLFQSCSRTAEQANAYAQCQKARTECTSLRSQLSLVQSRLRESESHREALHASLVTAETRVDRLQSETVLALQKPPGAIKPDTPIEESATHEVTRPNSPTRPQTQIHINGDSQAPLQAELDYWQEISTQRENKIKQLEEESVKLQTQIADLKLEASSPSKETAERTPEYKKLLDRATQLQQRLSDSDAEVAKLKTEVEELTRNLAEAEDYTTREVSKENQELKVMISKRDTDSLRLRDQRDQQAAEINERKQRDALKCQSLEQLKDLAESRSERIAALQSEVRRCRAQLAANAGDEELLAFILADQLGVESVPYVEHLKIRLAAAEARVDALEKPFSIFNEEHPDVIAHMKAEAEARQQLTVVTSQLQRYQATYGEPSPDIQQLEEQLRLKTEELRKLKMQEAQRSEAETAMYSELDRLSAAWEALDRQLKSKVLDLTAMEDKLSKSAHDRAKSDNKFYAAMRDKEAIEAERKNMSRTLEKQAKAFELLVVSDRSLTAQVADLEKEVQTLKKIVDTHQTQLRESEAECADLTHQIEAEKSRVELMRRFLSEREKSLDKQKTDLRRAEEGFVRSKKEAERQAAKSKTMNSGSSSQVEAELREELDVLRRIVKCSTCGINFRGVIITKCMHTFCKGCIDTRLATRQRKCPGCSVPFSASDVETLYFQ